MTRRSERMRTIQKIVVTFDICSSSNILEDLLRSESLKYWRSLQISIKTFLVKKSEELGFQLYKFTGDGWILLFNADYKGSVNINLLRSLSQHFDSLFERIILPVLETKPDLIGLTFGMGKGTLIKITMMGNKEYVGRAINVACRLQGSIKDKDSKPQYKVMISSSLYREISREAKDVLKECKVLTVQRKLRNIAGGKTYRCKKISLL